MIGIGSDPDESRARQAKKLGLRDESHLLLIDAPPGWAPEWLGPIERLSHDSIGAAPSDPRPIVTIAFVRDMESLDALTVAVGSRAVELAPVWICWPRRAGGQESDVGDEAVRAAGLSLGLVDNKVAAVDADWSGLRFARRRARH